VAAARSDGLHKLTTRLAKSHAVVVAEDLNVAGMTASAKGSGNWRGKAGLNRATLGIAPGELRRQLAYKAAWSARPWRAATGGTPPPRLALGARQ
jgi:putative transposase